MSPVVRTRFAPSPTGDPHVGNIRTALFAWLFARHNSGSFILRIEDTDAVRKVEGSVEAILDSLRWLGLDWDEGPDIGGDYGPYVQSERLELYQAAARRLVEQGDAYYCYCSPERLEEMRAEQLRRKQPPGYDRHCRELSEKERKQKENEGITPVVRFKVPLEGQTRFSDLVWGEVKFENKTFDDLVLLKSDGYPTYNLANIIDDHKMEISHVIRGAEFISTTPHHILLYKALEYVPPQFAHLPRLMGRDRSKLGKRYGATSIGEFRRQGYLPEAMLNFLALLGWSLDDKTELMSRQQFIDNFSLERVSKTAASFNPDKLDWMNGVYIRQLDPEDFLQRSLSFLERDLPSEVPRPLSVEYVRQIMPLVQERVKTLADVSQLTQFFFTDRLEYDAELLITKDMTAESTCHALGVARQRLADLSAFDEEVLEEMLRPLAVELELKTGQLFGALRTAVTGQTAAPPLFQTMAVLGREACLERIDRALDRL